MKKKMAAVLCVIMLLSMVFVGCESSKEVAVDTTGLKNLTMSGAATGTAGTEYTATLSAAENYELPESITVKVGGTALTEGYTYDSATGALTITADAVTGDISVSAEAPESLVGEWHGNIDITEIMNTTMDASDMGSYFTFKDLSIKMIMTFSKDGVYTMTMPQDTLKAMVEEVKKQMKPGFIKMFEDALKQANVDMTVEDYLKAANIDLDAMLDQAFNEESAKDMFKTQAQAGKYETKEGKLYMSEDITAAIDRENNNPYQIKEGKLTIEKGTADEDAAFMFPMVLERTK